MRLWPQRQVGQFYGGSRPSLWRRFAAGLFSDRQVWTRRRALTVYQRQRRRRWIVAGVSGILLLCIVAMAAYVVDRRLSRKRNLDQAVVLRDQGLALLARGEWAAAYDKLSAAAKLRDDPAVIRAICDALSNVDDPGLRSHRLAWLRRGVQLVPTDTATSAELQSLLLNYSIFAEALSLADASLARNPEDIPALDVRIRALAGLMRWKDALESCRTRDTLRPDELRGRIQSLAVRLQAGATPAELVSQMKVEVSFHPEDGNRKVLLSIALQAAGRSDESRKAVAAAASQPSKNPDDLSLLVRQLDSLELYDRTMELLRTLAAREAEPGVTSLLVTRLWEAQDLPALEQISRRLDPAKSPLGLLFYRAMAALGLGRPDIASAIADAAEKRYSREGGPAMARVLRLSAAKSPDWPQLYRAIQDLLPRQPQHPALYDLLGLASSQLGERELALEAWNQAASLAPAWAMPLARKAQALLDMGLTQEALEAAIAAATRNPQSPLASGVLTRAWAEHAQKTSGRLPGKASELLARIQKQVGPNQRLFSLYLGTLVDRGETDSARDELDRFLAAQSTIDPDELLVLAHLSARAKLGRDGSILDRYRLQYGPTPTLAVTAAIIEFPASGPRAALKRFDDIRASAPQTDTAQWAFRRVVLVEQLGLPEAAQGWKSLLAGDADAAVLSLALGVRSLEADREYRASIVARLRKMTGEASAGWRLAQARMALESGAEEKDRLDAVLVLGTLIQAAPALVEARLLRGELLFRTGNLQGSLDEFQHVLVIRPSLLSLRLRLAELHLARQRVDEARQELVSLLGDPRTDLNLRRAAALGLAGMGDFATAIPVLEGISRSRGKRGPDDVELARLLARVDRVAEALAILEPLSKAGDLSAVGLLADLHFAQGKDAAAYEALALMDSSGAPAAQVQARKAEVLVRNSRSEGTTQLIEAVRSGPPDPRKWGSLVEGLFHRSDPDRAWALAAEGAKLMGPQSRLARMLGSREQLDALMRDPALRDLPGVFLYEPQDVVQAASIVDLCAQAIARRAPVSPLLARIRAEVVRAPSPALWLLAARTFDQFDDLAGADRLLTLARERFALDAPLAQARARLLLRLGRAQPALLACKQWRQLEMRKSACDILEAQCYLALGQVAKAQIALDPLLAQGLPDVDKQPDLAEVAAQVMLSRSRLPEAIAWMGDKLPASPIARRLWAVAASGATVPVDVARPALRRLAGLIPPASPAENMMMTSAWLGVAARSGGSADLRDARAYLEQLRTLRPGDAPGLLLESEWHRLAGDFPKARQPLEQILKADADNYAAMNNLAYLMAVQGSDLGRARSLAQKTLDANPFHVDVLDTLAWVAQKQGDFPKASSVLTGLLDRDDRNQLWRLRLAYTQLQQGNKDAAKREFGLLPLDFSSRREVQDDERTLYLQLKRSL